MLLLLLLLLSWRARQATAYMGGQRCSKEMRNSIRLWIRRDPSLPRDSWQPFYWLGHHSRAAVVAHSWRIVDHCQTIDVDGCWQTVKLQSVLRLCSGFYRSKDPTNSIKVLKKVLTYKAEINGILHSAFVQLAYFSEVSPKTDYPRSSAMSSPITSV